MQKRIASDLLTYLPAKILPALTAIITLPIFTHLFSPEEYGKYVLAIGFADFLATAASTGFGAAAIRFYVSYKQQGRTAAYFATVLTSVVGVTLLGILASVILLLVFQSRLPDGLAPLLWAGIAVFAVNTAFTTLMEIIRAQEKSRDYTVLELLNRYGTVGVSLVLILVFSSGIAGLLWGEFITLLLLIVPLLRIVTRGSSVALNRLNRSDTRQVWLYAIPLTLGNLAVWGMRMADRYIIEFYHGSAQVGLYSVSYNISARSIDLLIALFLLVPAPIMMRTWEEQGREATETALTTFTRFFVVLVVPAVVGLIILAIPLVKVLADPAYLDGYQAVALVVLSRMAWGLGILGSYGVLLSRKTRLIAVTQGAATVASLLLNFLLIPRFGFTGAAASAFLSLLFLAFINMVASSRYLTWRFPLKTLARVAAASAAMAVVVFVANSFLVSGTRLMLALSLVGEIAVGALVYVGVLFLLGEVSWSQTIALFLPDRGDGEVVTSPKH